MPKKIKVTHAGLTSCPSCLSHIQVDADLSQVTCPFCDEHLTVSIQGTVGATTMELLRQSRSGLVAAALAGLAFTACGEPETKEPTDNNDAGMSQQTESDMGSNEQQDMAIEVDMVEEEPIVADYAAGPIDGG